MTGPKSASVNVLTNIMSDCLIFCSVGRLNAFRELYLERAEMHLGAIYTRHTLCRTTRLDWYLNLLNVKTSPQAKSNKIHKHKYTNTNTQIQIRKYKFTNTNTQLQIQKYKYTNTNTQTQIHKYSILLPKVMLLL